MATIKLIKVESNLLDKISFTKLLSIFTKSIGAFFKNSREEYLLLKEMDLDCIQGYYFGAPVEENVITEKLKA